MVVMADEVFDVLVTHDAVYRREPERNARQQRANVSRVNLVGWESIAPRTCPPTRVISLYDMADILIRDVPDEVVAAVDANAQRSGQTRAEYLRRLLADQQRPALTREQLNRFAERTADLGNPEVMAAAWR